MFVFVVHFIKNLFCSSCQQTIINSLLQSFVFLPSSSLPLHDLHKNLFNSNVHLIPFIVKRLETKSAFSIHNDLFTSGSNNPCILLLHFFPQTFHQHRLNLLHTFQTLNGNYGSFNALTP